MPETPGCFASLETRASLRGVGRPFLSPTPAKSSLTRKCSFVRGATAPHPTRSRRAWPTSDSRPAPLLQNHSLAIARSFVGLPPHTPPEVAGLGRLPTLGLRLCSRITHSQSLVRSWGYRPTPYQKSQGLADFRLSACASALMPLRAVLGLRPRRCSRVAHLQVVAGSCLQMHNTFALRPQGYGLTGGYDTDAPPDPQSPCG